MLPYHHFSISQCVIHVSLTGVLNTWEVIQIRNICLYHLLFFYLDFYRLVFYLGISVYSPINGGIVYSRKHYCILNRMKIAVIFELS